MSEFTDSIASRIPEGYDLCLDSICIEHNERRCTQKCWEINQENMSHDLGFSWMECDTCGSLLGGDRYTTSYVGNDIIELRSCQDCLIYIANGEEPNEN